MSVTDIVGEDMPIFMARLVAESGCIMKGGAAHVGSGGVTAVMLSWTSWRARRRSVPGLKISSMDDSWSTDFDRRTSRPSTPASACSSGVVTNASTSAADRPSGAVLLSTRGGANSGKTSTGIDRNWLVTSRIIPTAKATTRKRKRMLVAMTRRIMSSELASTSLGIADAGLGAEQLGQADRHDQRPGRRAVQKLGHVSDDLVDVDLRADEDERFGIGVDPGSAVGVVQHRRVGHGSPSALARLDLRRLDAEPFGRLLGDGHLHGVSSRSFDRPLGYRWRLATGG